MTVEEPGVSGGERMTLSFRAVIEEGDQQVSCEEILGSGSVLDHAALGPANSTSLSHAAGAESQPSVAHPIGLTRGEHVHARVLCVVHEVVDRVSSRSRAGVGTHRAVELRVRLPRGVGDEVAGG